MPVQTIASQEEYQKILSDAEATKLTWCGPCQTIKPFVEKYSDEYPHVAFVKVDVDAFEKLADDAEVTAMPTFQFHKANKKIAELKGDEAPELEALIKKHQALTEE
ncbi:hypothetical protein BGZ72_000589 [Mortierella alpina]|nr:hypothetical protein BGZ72_000589 [Mortierella alpina]